METYGECCSNTDIYNILKSDGTQKSNLLNFDHNVVSSIGTKYVDKFAIKVEPELEDFNIETGPVESIENNSEETKPGTKLLPQLADHGRIKNIFLDNSYGTAFSQHDNVVEPPVKHEAHTIIEININFVIKNGKLVLGYPYRAHSTTNLDRYKNIPNDEIVQPARVKNDEAIDTPDYISIFENSTIKNEEVDLKQEDLDVSEAGISPGYASQNKRDTARHRLDKNHEYETEVSQILSSKKLLLQHINPGQVNKFKCSHCEYQTYRKRNVMRHIICHMNPEELIKFKCSQCEYQTHRKCNLNQHLRCHMSPEKVNKFQCSQCEFQTLRNHSLKRHLLVHKNSNEKIKFKCSHCEYQTCHKGNLKQHLLRHKNPQEVNKFQCNHCEFQTLSKRNLRLHLLRHMTAKFKCSQCDFQTLEEVHLNRHLVRHMNPEEVVMLQCSLCEFQTLKKSNLRRHLVRHMNREEVNKFKGSQCGFQTRQEGNLKRH